jgi:hypothetical protein
MVEDAIEPLPSSWESVHGQRLAPHDPVHLLRAQDAEEGAGSVPERSCIKLNKTA